MKKFILVISLFEREKNEWRAQSTSVCKSGKTRRAA